MAKQTPNKDAFLLLADVKTALADRRPMTTLLSMAWTLCDVAQRLLQKEESDKAREAELARLRAGGR
jgi:hypothetical protein